jgi:hypothetical protein
MYQGMENCGLFNIWIALETMMPIENLDQWRRRLADDYETFMRQIAPLNLSDDHQVMLGLALAPILPLNAEEAGATAKMLESLQLCPPLAAHLREIGKKTPFTPPTLLELIQAVQRLTSENDQLYLDELISAVGARARLKKKRDTAALTARPLALPQSGRDIGLAAKEISTGGHFVVAGSSVTIHDSGISQRMEQLRCYLASLRAIWNTLDLNSIASDPARHVHTRLYDLYTPLDVWKPELSPERISALTNKESDLDLMAHREPSIQALNDHPHLVITGGPGTGKSTLTGFVTLCLAYACDPMMERNDQIRGLSRLGADWKHGALIPIYVNLRGFSADKSGFPKQARSGRAEHLLTHLRARFPDFAAAAHYLENHDSSIRGAVLMLDGLDEIYEEQDRINASLIIEDFAVRYPRCRIVVTSRTAAYRAGSAWRLSEKFRVVELAPYTQEQIRQYIDNWYAAAAQSRPGSFGGRDHAEQNARRQAKALWEALQDQEHLRPLARQPLLLTLIALIHEANRQMPRNRGELYEETVRLLNKWNPPNEDDPLGRKLSKLNHDRVRRALQLIAFNLQRQQHNDSEGGCVKRADLLVQLDEAQRRVGSLGMSIEEVLEYLATRNGILVSDPADHYRFIHLHIQEYLAACALIEQYNHVEMPRPSRPDLGEWRFPDNISALLNDDHERWREVALFCGAILGTDHGQDRLWAYVETLLPTRLSDLKEGDVCRIFTAGVVWSSNDLEPRLPTHEAVRSHLTAALKCIDDHHILDVPECRQVKEILKKLGSRQKPAAI